VPCAPGVAAAGGCGSSSLGVLRPFCSGPRLPVGRHKRAGWPLLRYTVEGAATRYEILGRQAYDLATGEEGAQDGERPPVVHVVIGGHHHEAVTHVEVGVRGGHTLALELDALCGQRKLDHA